RLWVGAAVAALALTGAVVMAIRGCGSSVAPPRNVVSTAPNPPPTAIPSGIWVRKGDGTETQAADFPDALQRASGQGGAKIVLRKSIPLRLTKPLEIAGDVVIEAAEGRLPILFVVMEGMGSTPFLSA